MKDLVGQQFGNYRLMLLLGKGGSMEELLFPGGGFRSY